MKNLFVAKTHLDLSLSEGGNIVRHLQALRKLVTSQVESKESCRWNGHSPIAQIDDDPPTTGVRKFHN